MRILGRHVSRLSGYAPAVPTPFDESGAIDEPALAHFCDRQIHAGATALVVCGTTGEAPTLKPAEHDRITRIAVEVADRRVPVIAGAGSNATSHAIELARIVEVAGADAILSVVPYYNKPTQGGLTAHFQTIAQSVGLPIILYDVPARTVCGLADDTVARLSELPQVMGLKDATGDVTRVARLRALVRRDFRLVSGDDATALAFLAQGGDGCISVTSNVAPGLCRDMFLACRHGQLARAQRLAVPIARLTAALFRESNPAPVKYALSMLGLMSSRLRLPLVEPTRQAQAELATVIADVYQGHADSMIGTIEHQAERRRAAVG
jgi:4-hydroxy-tetrahydrodipicolinate synthase